MLTIAIQITEVLNEYGFPASSNTYSVDWFRLSGRTAELPEPTGTAMDEAIEATIEADRHRRRPGRAANLRQRQAGLRFLKAINTLKQGTGRTATETEALVRAEIAKRS